MSDQNNDMSLTVSQIHSELAQLRREFDSVKATLDPVKGEKNTVEQQESALRQHFETTMRNLMEAKQALSQKISTISNNMNSITQSIEDKQRLLAQLLKEEANKRQLETLAQDLDLMLADYEAWNRATDYQKEDTLFALQAFRDGKNGILNSNDMGLGKTFESVILVRLLEQEWLRLHGRKPQVLWLTKKSLVKSTLREFHKWDKSRIMLPMMANNAKDREQAFDLIVNKLGAMLITNYEAMNTTAVLREFEWDIVFIDEVHKLKGGANLNGQTKIFKNAKALCQKARFVVMLSGTPMVNHPREMWSYLHIFDPVRFDSLRRFESMFCTDWDPKTATFKLDANALLRQALKGQVIRRRKDEVGIQLPELLHVYRMLEMSGDQLELAQSMADSFFIWLNKEAENKTMISAASIIARLTRLRQINLWPPSIKIQDEDNPKIKHSVEVRESVKIDEAMDLIENINDADDQIVIACCFNEPLFEIQRRCKELDISCDVLYGANSADTDKFEQRFQQKEVTVLCMNMDIGAGLNLHKNAEEWPGGASNLVMMDLWWSPARNEQMQARIHRPGAKQTCTIHILHNEQSVDNIIAAIVEDKAAQFANIMESKQLRPAVEWMELITTLMKKEKEEDD